MRDRLLEPRDDFFLLGDQRVELRDLDGVVALLVLAKAEEIRDVLRPPPIEEQIVLAVDRGPQRLGLVEFGTCPQDDARSSSSSESAVVTLLPSIFSSYFPGQDPRSQTTAGNSDASGSADGGPGKGRGRQSSIISNRRPPAVFSDMRDLGALPVAVILPSCPRTSRARPERS